MKLVTCHICGRSLPQLIDDCGDLTETISNHYCHDMGQEKFAGLDTDVGPEAEVQPSFRRRRAKAG